MIELIRRAMLPALCTVGLLWVILGARSLRHDERPLINPGQQAMYGLTARCEP